MIKNADSLSEYFAQIITSRHNQHAIILIVGAAGMGKSWAGIQLATEISKCVAGKLGGNPSDYYNFNDCLAVMSSKRLKEVMDKPKPHTIIHIDDAGVPLNARKFMKTENIEFNNVLQTFRPNHNIVIITAQAGFLLDKVVRTLAHYIIEMDTSMYHIGVNIAKVNRVVYKHKLGKIYYPYIKLGGVRYIRHIFEKPPKELTDEYERIRAIQLAKINDEEKVDEQVVGKRTLADIFQRVVIEKWENGETNLTKIAREVSKNPYGLKCNHQLVRRILDASNLRETAAVKMPPP